MNFIPIIEKNKDIFTGRILNFPGYKIEGSKEEIEAKLDHKIQQLIHPDREQKNEK